MSLLHEHQGAQMRLGIDDEHMIVDRKDVALVNQQIAAMAQEIIMLLEPRVCSCCGRMNSMKEVGR